MVDGDAFWIAGEKVRVADIDAPEIEGRCPYERQLAARARDMLLVLLNAGPFALRRSGADRYGRTQAVVTRNGRSIGPRLVNEHLARKWGGRRQSWR
ncbi:thermonuclease family protein [Croceibacterium salegens]|uniref:thermonuclease family protein n=1 Tax=Croceibacterium salegens TaxID=1737568 RepID=UPI002E26CC0F